MGMHVVVIGNPFYGLKIVGPFNNIEEAIEWADLRQGARPTGLDWWAVPLMAQDADVAND